MKTKSLIISVLSLLSLACSKDDDSPEQCPCQKVLIESKVYDFRFCSEEERLSWERNATTKEAELRDSRNECD